MSIINKILGYKVKNIQILSIMGMIAFGTGAVSALALFKVDDYEHYLRATPLFLVPVYYVFNLIGKDNPSLNEWATNTFVGII